MPYPEKTYRKNVIKIFSLIKSIVEVLILKNKLGGHVSFIVTLLVGFVFVSIFLIGWIVNNVIQPLDYAWTWVAKNYISEVSQTQEIVSPGMIDCNLRPPDGGLDKTLTTEIFVFFDPNVKRDMVNKSIKMLAAAVPIYIKLDKPDHLEDLPYEMTDVRYFEMSRKNNACIIAMNARDSGFQNVNPVFVDNYPDDADRIEIWVPRS